MKENIFVMLFAILCVWGQPTHSMDAFEQFPAELLQEIAGNLSKKNIKNLRLTSKTWKLASQPKWELVKSYISFPDTYGLEQIGTNLFKYSPPKKQKNKDDRQCHIVTDLNDLTVCPIPGCNSKIKPRTNRLGHLVSGLTDHLYLKSSNCHTKLQHLTLADLIELLHNKPYAFVPDRFTESEGPLHELGTNASFCSIDQLTQAQKKRVIAYCENKFESLSAHEKEIHLRDRKAKQEEKKAKQEEKAKKLEQWKHLETREKVYMEQQVLAIEYNQISLSSDDVVRRAQAIEFLTSPEETLPISRLDSHPMSHRQAPTYTFPACPPQNLTLYSAVNTFAHDNTSAYLEDDIADLEELIYEEDADKKYLVDAIISSLDVHDDAQDLQPLFESFPFPIEKTEPQSRHGKREADFPEDEPSHKHAHVFAGPPHAPFDI